jgi:hypothetical protein
MQKYIDTVEPRLSIVAVSSSCSKSDPLIASEPMEQIIFGLVGLLSRLTNSWTNLITSIRETFASWFSRFRRLLEAAAGMTLWCVPLVFWSIVVRFVVKHW